MNRNLLIIVSWLLLSFQACDKTRVFDENKEIANEQWYYKNHLLFDVNIEDTSRLYNIYVNLRVSNDYKYCNLFMMVLQINPDKQLQKERKEFTLADENGRWLGKGLGDMYDYQIPVYKNTRFYEKGIYRFELEQNMRNDTLLYIKSAGIRIEEVVSE
ncbi:MAG: gliding motility lipoprotein GldH [Bacteroidia bacterium]|nr:gliding motility lipoprotein GldH [Bacteroidia bacterium]